MATSLAREVRTATDSEEFDLAGYNLQKCHDFCKAAFAEPLPLSKMVRLSFICGGGKLTRQKYTDALPKEFMVALAESGGYSQDNAAALTMESAGTFKYQHDTNKNLIFVHVYPKLAPPEAEAEAEGEEEEERGPQDPADVLAECEMDDFARVLEGRVVTYAGKRRVLDAIKARIAKMEVAEQKLINRQTLDPDEQKMYDTLSIDGLKEKVKAVSQDLQSMATTAGKLTQVEHAFVLEDFAAKMQGLQEQISKAEGKDKLLQKLQEQQSKLEAMTSTVKAIEPARPPPLRHGQDIQKLRMKVASLTKLEAGKGPFSIDQLKAIAEKPELEEAIDVLERRSRFWFESDAEFKVRLDMAMSQPVQKKKTGGGSGGGGSSSGGWSTAGKRR